MRAQSLSQRGFVEGDLFLFPQSAVNDPTHGVADLLVRDDVFVKVAPWLRLAGGMEFRANSHDQVEDRWRLDFSDRGVRRPRLSVRRLAATFTHDWLTVDLGKQFIRWGKTDIVNPTDRFAPRDFLNVFDNDFLAVTGARAVAEIRHETIDVVWVPRFTPSRIPLLDQRWTAVPPEGAGIAIVDAGSRLPDGGELGVRWNHVGDRFEASASWFDGFNHLPNVVTSLVSVPGPAGQIQVNVAREFPQIRMWGGDAAIPLRWVTLKGEAGYFTSSSSDADEYVLYVVQVERQTGEWVLAGGYAGEVVTERRAALTFAPDRGIARSVIARASYTIDPNRSLTFEGAVRQSGNGAYAKVEYSQAAGQHWRTTLGATLIRGDPTDFLGQYRRNSHVTLSTRYSF